MSTQLGELHKTYYTTTASMNTTMNARNLCRLPASSSSTKLTTVNSPALSFFSAGDNQQWIADNKLSIAALTETWLDDAASPDLIACAPAGLKFVEKARARTNELSTLT